MIHTSFPCVLDSSSPKLSHTEGRLQLCEIKFFSPRFSLERGEKICYRSVLRGSDMVSGAFGRSKVSLGAIMERMSKHVVRILASAVLASHCSFAW